jgi:hypothetical protein
MATVSRVTAFLAAGLLSLAACTGAGESETPGPTAPTGETSEGNGAEVIVGDVAPLTGLPFGDANLNYPALSAKVDNHPAARPQVALDQADIVFEELVEGGLTRYVAVWHSNLPPEIGPVRSVRPMDPDIVSPFGGILAYSGGQQRFVEAMLRTPVESAIHGQSNVSDFFYRSSDKVAPHNVIVRAVELVQNFSDKAPPAPQFSYASAPDQATAPVSGEPVSSLTTRFSSFQAPGWEWSEAEGAFARSQTNGAADVALSGSRILAANVVAIFVDIQVIQDIPTTFLVDSGDGYVASAGHIIPVTWSKASPEEPIILRTLSGDPVTLAAGITWVKLLPAEGSGVPTGAVLID